MTRARWWAGAARITSIPGLQWTVGPYRFRGMLGFNNYSGGNNAVNSRRLAR